MEEVRREVRALSQEVRGIRDDIAELKRLLTGAYGSTKSNGNGNGQGAHFTYAASLGCSHNPFQTHRPMPDGSCACQHAPWART